MDARTAREEPEGLPVFFLAPLTLAEETKIDFGLMTFSEVDVIFGRSIDRVECHGAH